ncbi:MAG TPA: amino acid ABC transporter substrate-binding protein [Arcobacter sp.]|nr:amino acid ABC transporter substrate-binding protein [Arcobacter sp.]
MKNKFIYLLLVFFICLNNLDANKLDDIKKSGVLYVGIENEFAPFNFLSRKGNRIGFDIDIINYVANNLGVKIKFTTMPFSKLIPSVRDGKIDVAIAAILHKQSREENVDFSITYMYDGQSIMSKKSSTYKNYKSFEGKTVGAIIGHTSGKVFEAISPLSNVVYFNNLLEIKEALLHGVIDAATSDETALSYIVKKYETKLAMVGSKFTVQPYGIVLSQNESDFRDAVNFSIQKLVKEKKYDKIYKKWFHRKPIKRPVLWP